MSHIFCIADTRRHVTLYIINEMYDDPLNYEKQSSNCLKRFVEIVALR